MSMPNRDSRGRRAQGIPYRVHRDRLPGGLRLVTIETPYLHGATVALYVRAGSRYETAATNGLSHFVEHMLFRGSAHFPDSYALNRAIEERGGTLYAETGRDHSLYQISLHPRHVPGALDILGDLFSAPAFRDIDLERDIVLEEILGDFDEQGRKIAIDDLARESAFPRHPLGMSIVGPAKNVRRFGVRDVRRHFGRFYGARNMVLCVAGRVRRGEVAAATRRAFGKVTQGRLVASPPPRVSQSGPRFRKVWSDSAQTQLQMLFHGPSELDPEYAALVALMRVLDDGMSTRLHYQVCDQKGLAYQVSAAIEPFFDAALVEIDAACAHTKVPELTEEILDILTALRSDGVSRDELDKAKARYLADLEAGFDDVDGLAGWFGGAELFFRPYSHAERVARMRRVSRADVRRVARRVFDRRRLTAVAVGALGRGGARRVQRLIGAF